MADNNFYLELLKDSNLTNISNEDKEIITIKIWTLLGKVTERYTMGDSSSVPVEIAEELLKSITFLLKKEMKNGKFEVDIFECENLEGVWKDSWITIEKDIAMGKDLLEEVIKTSTGIENISYDDTVMGIEKGLKIYDYRFLAHEVPCSIDYQLSNPVDEDMQGIDFINEYLTRLLFENKFCNNFEKEKIIGILKSYCRDYKGLLINIFDPVLTNVIGLEMLEADIFELEIKSYEREILLYTFKKMNMEEDIIKAASNICNKLKIVSDYEINYVKMTVLNLLPRIKEGIKNNNIENIFLSYKIEEDEVEEIVNNLNKEEVEALKYYLNNKLNDNISNTGWEQKFIK